MYNLFLAFCGGFDVVLLPECLRVGSLFVWMCVRFFVVDLSHLYNRHHSQRMTEKEKVKNLRQKKTLLSYIQAVEI